MEIAGNPLPLTPSPLGEGEHSLGNICMRILKIADGFVLRIFNSE